MLPGGIVAECVGFGKMVSVDEIRVPIRLSIRAGVVNPKSQDASLPARNDAFDGIERRYKERQ